MIADLLEDATSQADSRNGEMLNRLLDNLRPLVSCRFCHYKYDYVFWKITAHRIKRRMEWTEVDLSDLRRDALARAATGRENMYRQICQCEGKTWKIARNSIGIGVDMSCKTRQFIL